MSRRTDLFPHRDLLVLHRPSTKDATIETNQVRRVHAAELRPAVGRRGIALGVVAAEDDGGALAVAVL